MAKVIRIIDHQFRKMRESIARSRVQMKERHTERMKETDAILQKIHNDRAEFERRWFKIVEGGL